MGVATQVFQMVQRTAKQILVTAWQDPNYAAQQLPTNPRLKSAAPAQSALAIVVVTVTAQEVKPV